MLIDAAQDSGCEAKTKLMELARTGQPPPVGQVSEAPPRAMLGKQFAKQVGRARRGEQQQKHYAEKLRGAPIRQAPRSAMPRESLTKSIIWYENRELVEERGSAGGG